MRRAAITLAAALIVLACGAGGAPAWTNAATVAPCRRAGFVSTAPTGAALCRGVMSPDSIFSPIGIGSPIGVPLPVGGLLGGAFKTVAGTGARVAADAAVGAIASVIDDGARAALQATAKLIGGSTRPDLSSVWFSSEYWRVAGVSALLTIPFLLAAAIQALLRSDLTLLLRAALGYLPLAALSVGVAAPVTMLLLAATDEMSTIVSATSGQAGEVFLGHAGAIAGSMIASNPFVTCFVALLTVGGAITLWLELLVRAAAVYVIVLMLPLFFAAMVWPARRVWAIRAVEVLVALILSKFAILAVLTLGGAALDHASSAGPAAFLTGLTLVLLAAFAPWAMLRLLPLHEVASAAAGGLRSSAVAPLTSTARGAVEAADVIERHLGRGPRTPDDPAVLPSTADTAEPCRLPAGGEGSAAGRGASDAEVEEPIDAVARDVAGAGGAGPTGPASATGAGSADTGTSAPQAAAGDGGPTASGETTAGGDALSGGAPAAGVTGGGHLTARGLENMDPIWHGRWRELTLDGTLDPDRSVAEPLALPEPSLPPEPVDGPPDATGGRP